MARNPRAVAQARRNNLVAADKADRATAVLFTADAYAAALSGDTDSAFGEVKAALKLAPGFAPAALLAARLFADAGKKGKSAKTIETAFSIAPHRALIKAFDLLYTEELPENRAEHLCKLAEKNSAAHEAVLLKARAKNLTGEWAGAMNMLEPLLGHTPTAAEFTLMADAVAGRDGVDAARPWLERAANAPLDPQPGADGEFHFTRDGWAQLVREYMEHERLAPPPLEEISLGMSVDEIRLLTAPQIIDAPLEEPLSQTHEAPVAGDENVDAPADKTPIAPQDDSDDHIHNDEEAERIAAAAREVS